MFHVPNRYRITEGRLSSKYTDGNNGLFMVPRRYYAKPEQERRLKLRVVASDGGIDSQLWEHVSVSMQNRCPTWEEMCWIKSIFWDEEDTVIQYHPAKSEYVNCHPFWLHLWRPVGQSIPIPPSIMVGPKS